MNKTLTDPDYKQFLAEVKDRIFKAQYEALKRVNRQLIELYWDIGRMIVERQNEHGWGKSVVQNLAEDLQKEFPGIRGFSSSNLWRMKLFFETYNENEKLAPLVREISWSHNIVILEKCKDDLEKEFYTKMTKKFGWTKNVLIHQIDSKSYEKFLLNQTSFDKTLPDKYKHQAKLAVKDRYTFDFLELSEEHAEKELEIALINNIRKFLAEMGRYFAFIGNQYRLELDDEEYFIDLLLYHRILKSLVVVELKIGKFRPEYAGKMQFYLSVLDDKVKLPDENYSIGIIICRDKNRTVVEYTLKDVNKPIGVSTYTIGSELPEDIRHYLPSPAEIAERLSSLEIDIRSD